jgi:hypothetical protein
VSAKRLLEMGKTVIFTDLKGLTSRQIVEIYDFRNQIETDIIWLNDKLLIPLKRLMSERTLKYVCMYFYACSDYYYIITPYIQ